MCDVQGNLIAWMDRELRPDEAAGVERHVEGCEECRSQLTAYRAISKNFEVYCAAVTAAKTRRTVSRWVPALASVAVALAVLFLAFRQVHVEPPPVLTPVAVAASVPVPVSAPEPAPRKAMQKRRARPAVRRKTAKWQSAETAVQIAIPAETMFAPGAMPEGMSFIAELSIAPDGSIKQVRLRQ
jgi:anti-sigma factor RsiW